MFACNEAHKNFEFHFLEMFIKIKKGHAIITIDFETLFKSCQHQVLRKTQKSGTFRSGHTRVKETSSSEPRFKMKF